MRPATADNGFMVVSECRERQETAGALPFNFLCLYLYTQAPSESFSLLATSAVDDEAQSVQRSENTSFALAALWINVGKGCRCG